MKKLSQVLERMFEKNRKLQKLRIFSVKSLWEDVVGRKIAERAKVVNFDGGILYIECNDPMWKAELELRKDTLVVKINERIGKDLVKKITIRRGHCGKERKK